MANWDQPLNLIPIIIDTTDGFEIPVEGTPRMVYGNELDVRSNEYWQAQNAGIALTHMFEIRSVEYQGEERLQFGEPDNKHDIVRTYKKGEFIELVCQKASEDHA